MGSDMTQAALSPLIAGARFAKLEIGTGFRVLSAFARLNVDPWQESMSLRECRKMRLLYD